MSRPRFSMTQETESPFSDWTDDKMSRCWAAKPGADRTISCERGMHDSDEDHATRSGERWREEFRGERIPYSEPVRAITIPEGINDPIVVSRAELREEIKKALPFRFPEKDEWADAALARLESKEGGAQ